MSHLYRHPPKTGKYWLAYRHNGKLYRESLKTKDRAQAKYLKAKKEQELAHGRAILPNVNQDLDYLLKEYIAASQGRKRPKTITDDNKRIKDFFTWAHARRISDINPKRMQEYLASRIPGISEYTANRIIIAVKALLNFAVDRIMIPVNPIRKFKLFKPAEKYTRFLSLEERNRLLAAAKHEDLYPAVVAAVYGGMRKMELFTLEWQDINFSAGTITVRNKEGFTTKNKRFRVIPLHSEIKKVLWPKRKKAGRVFDITNQRRVFRRICRRSGIQDIGWHTLRHTFVSLLVQDGVSLYKVGQWAGHSSMETTKGYAHLAPGKDKDIERL